jgi:hypothetical protein
MASGADSHDIEKSSLTEVPADMKRSPPPTKSAGNYPSSAHSSGVAAVSSDQHLDETLSAGSPTLSASTAKSQSHHYGTAASDVFSSKNSSPVRYASTAAPVSNRLFPKYHLRDATTANTTDATSTGEKKVSVVSQHLTRPRKVRELAPINRGPTLTLDNQQQLCKRLYEMSLQRIKMKIEKQEALIKKHEFPSKTLSVEEQDEMVQRMYYNQRKHDETAAKKLAEKYVTVHPFLVISKEQVVESNKRLYYDRRLLKKENYDKLYDKYITQTNPKYMKMSPDTQAAMVQRLHMKGD